MANKQHNKALHPTAYSPLRSLSAAGELGRCAAARGLTAQSQADTILAMNLRHNLETVRALHQAYADKTQSSFSGLEQIPGNPYQVQIRSFGATRTFIARGHDWSNRVTLNGDESFELIEEILSYYDEHQQKCHIEWNPAICYRPQSWNDELGHYLLSRGFSQGGFRCVWHRSATAEVAPTPSGLVIRHFGPDEAGHFIDILMEMEKKDAQERRTLEHNIAFAEGSAEWHHYIGYLDGSPCCTATLFENGHIGCLDWGHTLAEFRRRGCHKALIERRVLDAHNAGCEQVFAITDFNIPSAANLQHAGFQLAYNYAMRIREPLSQP